MGVVLTQTVTLPARIEVILLIIVLFVLCAVLFGLVIGQRREIRDMDKRLRRLTRGKNAANLESEIVHLFDANDILTESARDVQERMTILEQKLSSCVQKTGLIKYDAFNQMGGKLSFALALLNDDDDGLILNSVHSPEGNYTYVKEVVAGKSELELAQEEQLVLNRALARAQRALSGERRQVLKARADDEEDDEDKAMGRGRRSAEESGERKPVIRIRRSGENREE